MEESISGRSFRAIQAAIPELERNKLGVEGYRIRVHESGASVFVLFGDPNAPKGLRGSWGDRPAFSVELARDDLRIIRSQFER
jgi:hypothetical protein